MGLLAGVAAASLMLANGTPAMAASARAPKGWDGVFKALYAREWTWREIEFAHGDEGDAVPLPGYYRRWTP